MEDIGSVLPIVYIPLVTGHGAMVIPFNWFYAGGLEGMKPGGRCEEEVDYGKIRPCEYLDIKIWKLVKTSSSFACGTKSKKG